MQMYLKGRNFRGKKFSWISQILAKFPKINSFVTPKNVYSRKFIPATFFKIGDSRKSILSDTVSFELGLLETIGYFVICLSKKILIFTGNVLKTIN